MRTGLVPALVAAMALAGCGPESSGDAELAVYLSAPLSGPRASDGRDIADGAELALADAGGEAAGTPVSLEVSDDADAGGWDAARTGANARRATEDSTAIAYIGELDSGATRTSLPITNEAGLLQVSAGSGAGDLTRDFPGSSQIPDLVQPSGSRTFARVIPSDVAQGEGAAALMARSGIESVAIIGDDSAFAESLTTGFESVTGAPATAGPDAEAVYVAQADLAGAEVPQGAEVFGTDALLDPRDLRGLEAVLTAAALEPGELPQAGADFAGAFAAEYGREPGPYAAYGYEAMAATLDSIERAEDPLDRSAVIDAFFAIQDRESVLGTYSIDDVGETTLGLIGAYEVAGGEVRPLDPVELP